MNLKSVFSAFLLVTAISTTVSGQKIKALLENQVSGWATMNFSDPLRYQLGGRYIPAFSLADSLKKHRKLDAEISVNTYGALNFEGKNYDDSDKGLKPYRMWLRYSTPRFELRAGLQKINFGSASVLRPLMWFDKMDYRDPLQLTDGVYGVLGRYYLKQTINLWLWSLYGNDKPGGWEMVPSAKKIPEYGGRIQLPIPGGELAVSYHKRTTDFRKFYPYAPDTAKLRFPEEKVGIDFKVDIGVGLWAEYVMKHNDPDNGLLNEWETYLNLGMDYTFGIGNGLTVATEYFRYDNKAKWNGMSVSNKFSVLTMNYPLGLMNNALAMVFYNWDTKDWYRFISLQRKYDYLSFYLMAYWNPDQFGLYNSIPGKNLFAGKGIQFMTVLNF